MQGRPREGTVGLQEQISCQQKKSDAKEFGAQGDDEKLKADVVDACHSRMPVPV